MNSTESFKQWFMCKGNPERKIMTWSKFTEKTESDYRFWKRYPSFAILAIFLIVWILPDSIIQYKDKFLVVTALAGVIVTLVVGYVSRYYNNKKLQTTSLFKVYELLSRQDVREARRNIHEEYCKQLKTNKKNNVQNKEIIFEGTGVEKDMDLVLSSFDQVSGIVLNGLIDEELFFDLYGGLVVRDWKTLKGDIEIKQKRNEKAVRHFTGLKKKFEQRSDIGNTEPYCENDVDVLDH